MQKEETGIHWFSQIETDELENVLKCQEILLENGADPIAVVPEWENTHKPTHLLDMLIGSEIRNTFVSHSPSFMYRYNLKKATSSEPPSP